MTANMAPLEVRVWGDLACFTRPEMKVERVSYPVMTPTAARGVLEAIFWKPQFAWHITEILVLRPIRYASLLRNEINTRQSERTASGWMRQGTGGYSASEDRAQRHTLALRNVDYVIRAEIDLKRDVTDDIAKYRDQFRRRVHEGRSFAQPYLGCREFSAYFAPPAGNEEPAPIDDNIGPMLLAIDYAADGSGRGTPRFFDARLEGGVLRVPTDQGTS
jgi:CRISPR-associated protein Cas5d